VERTKLPDVHLLLDALNFAALRHRTQRRKGRNGAPYVNHLIEVAHILALHGVDDADTLRAAVLHDSVEDAEVRPEELRERFGRNVAELVGEVTDEVALPVWRRKLVQIEQAPHISPGAQAIRVADKISNLRGILTSPPTTWSLERKLAYYAWARQVVDGCTQAPESLRATFSEVHTVGMAVLYASQATQTPPAAPIDEAPGLLEQLDSLDPIGS
jgi:guanosine-3',5'-bis(diphosphate) 3'-pyrophosphohydrolase